MNFSANTRSRSGNRMLLLAALLSGIVGTAPAASKIYLKLEDADITSDGLPDEWHGWIAGRAFGQGYRCAPPDSASADTQVVPQLSRAFHIVKHVDRATPLLSRAALEGQVFPTLTVITVRGADLPENRIRIVLENVRILSIQRSGGTLDSVRPTERITDRLTEEVAFGFDGAAFLYGGDTNAGQPDRTDTPPRGMDPLFAIDPDNAPDSDGDGLPDRFEVAHGLNPNGDDCDEDPDGDGLTNGQEFAGGSAPNDRRSRFGVDRITVLRDKPGRGTVSFRALPGRQYRLLGSPTGQRWFELSAFSVPLDGETAQQEIEMPFGGLAQLLRVEVSIQRP